MGFKSANGAVLLIITVIFCAALAAIAQSQPISIEGAAIVGSERKPADTAGLSIQAQAGNVTQLNVNGSRITSNWQGYYGNVSGEITLDDADSNTLYAWDLTSISGEIYATNNSGTVLWTNITCPDIDNVTGSSSVTGNIINASSLNQQYFISEADQDSFNATFNRIFDSPLLVGSRSLTSASHCASTYLFVNNQSQTSDFQEVLLYDNQSSVVYTAILDPATTGFDAKLWDFQMLVAQRNSTVGTYYFYVELS